MRLSTVLLPFHPRAQSEHVWLRARRNRWSQCEVRHPPGGGRCLHKSNSRRQPIYVSLKPLIGNNQHGFESIIRKNVFNHSFQLSTWTTIESSLKNRSKKRLTRCKSGLFTCPTARRSLLCFLLLNPGSSCVAVCVWGGGGAEGVGNMQYKVNG